MVSTVFCVYLQLHISGAQSGSYQTQFSPANITAEEQVGLESVLRLTAIVADKVRSNNACYTTADSVEKRKEL